MALSGNRDLVFYTSQELIDLPVDDAERIYKGALVGRNRATGYARGLVAGDEFVGIAYQEADNTGPGHAAGAVNVRLHQNVDVVHTITGVVVSDIGRDVYASDDGSLTLTPGGYSRVGRVVAFESGSLARVRCRPVSSAGGGPEPAPVTTLADANATLSLDHMNRVLLIGNSAARTLTLPPVASVRAGAWFQIVKTSAAAAAVTLDGSGSETIDGATSYTAIDAQYDVAHVVCTGTEWVIVSRDVA